MCGIEGKCDYDERYMDSVFKKMEVVLFLYVQFIMSEVLSQIYSYSMYSRFTKWFGDKIKNRKSVKKETELIEKRN